MAGFILDIDGVLVNHGRTPIPGATEALVKIKDSGMPYCFVTNRDCMSTQLIAQHLGKALNVEIKAAEIIIPQTPLYSVAKNELADKKVLFISEKRGDSQLEYAKSFGLNNIVTVDELADQFPHNDLMDRSDLSIFFNQAPAEPENFDPIEAIIIISGPKNWERHLQLLLDVIIGSGHPNRKPATYPKLSKPQIPIYTASCETIFRHRAIQIPRLGNYAFLVALEALFQKITGEELKYAAVYGKPAPHTYLYAIDHLKSCFPGQQLDEIYCVGDTPISDINGANGAKGFLREGDPCLKSVLVKTGNYQGGELDQSVVTQGHRDFMDFSVVPDVMVENIKEIVDMIVGEK